MPVNIAAKRFAKAQKRKAAVAEKRKAEVLGGTLAGRVRQAAALPIQYCVISRFDPKVGMGAMMVARGMTQYSVTAAVFLIDALGYGVKNVFLRDAGVHELDRLLEGLSTISPLVAIDPGEARFILHELVRRAQKFGVRPHPDYEKIEPIFGSVQATPPENVPTLEGEVDPTAEKEVASLLEVAREAAE
jgi:hypothetical protein